MKILAHDKVYQTTTECVIGNLPELKTTKMTIELDTRNNQIDNIIYLLMCAEAKKEDSSALERSLAKPRYEKAFEQLQEFLSEFIEEEIIKDNK